MRRSPRKSPRQRSGFTLIELAFAITAASIVLTLSVGLIHSSMHWSRRCTELAHESHTLDRFQRQFREDVHAANAAELKAGILQLGLDFGQVEYFVDGSRLTRIESRNDTASTREDFQLALDERLTLTLEILNEPSRVRIRLEKTGADDQSSVALRRELNCVVGLLHRHRRSNAEDPLL